MLNHLADLTLWWVIHTLYAGAILWLVLALIVKVIETREEIKK